MKTHADGEDDDVGAGAAAAADGDGPAAAGGGKRRKSGAGAGAGADAGAGAGALASASNYKGLSIRVSFSEAGESKDMNALSGGQKSLVALSLIFAIQRSDPAPFYVFDEIDSALDAVHRGAVGALIKKQTYDKDAPAQFITSTFSPEIVAFADAWFGVELQQKTSSIGPMDKDEALAFVHAANASAAAGADAGGAGEGAGAGAGAGVGGKKASKKARKSSASAAAASSAADDDE